ncbi:potassium voltage-gated channel subfamily KQT member 1-like isoform X2 [Hydractinia symbiolongicarpus]|uniref:potassium voltage-gated channel subfamily KQT member 1-like isoform X2 n=1 Tax=Hydractinia symbiolongicarpus TaxID=13093 RepID=UPI0025519D60|nr:potassium voltage-gated channel subfamily KQT member 1-like isoform X2 [Hydractinia symbiolongicarpus]
MKVRNGSYEVEMNTRKMFQQKVRARENRTCKTQVYQFLNVSLGRTSVLYQLIIVVLIVASLALGIADSVKEFQNGWIQSARITLEILLLVVFFTEYLLRVWSSGAHGTYGAAGGLKKYLLTPHMVIDALVITSSLGLVISSKLPLRPEHERLLYLLQLLRILRIDRQRGAFRAFWKVFKRHRKELLTCWYMGFLMVTFVSFFVYALEGQNSKNEYTIDNLFNGVYWGVISLTTIGYGDINPDTTSAKILICCFAIFGTCFLAMPAGIIGSGFALQVAEQQKEKHVNRRRRPAAVLIQSFWRKYAADNNFKATWLPHIKGREEKFQRRQTTKAPKADMFGMPFTPIFPSMARYGSVIQDRKEVDVSEEGTPTTNGKNALWFPRKALTNAEKKALRFIRLLKCISSAKKFRQARRPYDERDVLDQFASSQIEMFAKLRDVKDKFEACTEQTAMQTAENGKKVKHLEKEINTLNSKVAETNDLLRLLLRQHGVNLTKDETLEEPNNDGTH